MENDKHIFKISLFLNSLSLYHVFLHCKPLQTCSFDQLKNITEMFTSDTMLFFFARLIDLCCSNQYWSLIQNLGAALGGQLKVYKVKYFDWISQKTTFPSKICQYACLTVELFVLLLTKPTIEQFQTSFTHCE